MPKNAKINPLVITNFSLLWFSDFRGGLRKREKEHQVGSMGRWGESEGTREIERQWLKYMKK